MMRVFAAPKREGHASSVSKGAVARLKNVASSPWGVACSSFLMTALFIQIDRPTFF